MRRSFWFIIPVFIVLMGFSPNGEDIVQTPYNEGEARIDWMTLEEAAEALGVSRATASRHWTYAKAWLYRAIKDSDDVVR